MGRKLYKNDVTWLAFNAFHFYFNQTFHNLFNMNKWLHFTIILINTFGIIISLEIYGDINNQLRSFFYPIICSIFIVENVNAKVDVGVSK